MCGRYVLYGPRSRLVEQFDPGFDELHEWPSDFELFNIAPTQMPPVVRARPDGARDFIAARWGLLPAWVKEPGKLAQPINAKLETAAGKPMFRSAFRKSRVLVPASGFYEWQSTAGGKQPFYIHPVGVPFFGFGGLLEHWHGPDGPVLSFAILTTTANDTLGPIHDRMPVVIHPDDYRAWLDPKLTDASLVRDLTKKGPALSMAAYPVGRAVGNPRAQGAALIEPIRPPEESARRG